jgi:hypothetical protein
VRRMYWRVEWSGVEQARGGGDRGGHGASNWGCRSAAVPVIGAAQGALARIHSGLAFALPCAPHAVPRVNLQPR